MAEEPFVKFINGHFIDTREDKIGTFGKYFKWESNDEDALRFYRCNLCHRVVSLFDLRKHHACKFCGGARISPTNLTMLEKVIQILKHPKVWEWKNQKNKL